jgi:hypothetical protein
MINHFRTLVQEKLDTIQDLDSGETVSDEMIEDEKYYFGYKISTVGNRYNLDYSNKTEYITLTGYLSTKNRSLAKLDSFTDEIMSKLAELRLNCSANDITTLDSKVRKVLITGTVKYDYLDGLLK